MADAIANVTAYLATTLATVSGIGLIHPYEPVAIAPGQIPAQMGASGSIHFWTVKRTTTRQAWLANIDTERFPQWTIRGYYEVGDASVSEPLVQALVERIMTTFRAIYQAPQSTGADAEQLQPLQLVECGYRMLAETFLVHYVELTTTAVMLVTP